MPHQVIPDANPQAPRNGRRWSAAKNVTTSGYIGSGLMLRAAAVPASGLLRNPARHRVIALRRGADDIYRSAARAE